MPKLLPIFVALSLLFSSASDDHRYRGQNDHLQAARDIWRTGDVAGASAEIERALQANPDDPDAHAWLAEALRRQEEFASAQRHAQRALEMAPDHAFALAVLGDLYNPQFHGDPALQNQDDSLKMYRAALAADPHDPQALMGLCTWSLRQGDRATTQACLAAMDTSGLWSECIVALARWMLESAPSGSVLLLNGDADSFPIWMLQERGIRTDVIACNLSLLNLPDYISQMARAGMPLPAEPLQHTRLPGGNIVTISQLVFTHWLELHNQRQLDRPLAIAITVSDASLPQDAISESYLRGGVVIPGTVADINDIDIEATRPLMRHVSPQVVAGTWFTPRERSPVRLRGGQALRHNPMHVAVRGFCAAVLAADVQAAGWYRDLYLAYRAELGAAPAAEAAFAEAEVGYEKLPR